MKIRFVITAFLIILFVPFGFVKAQNISDEISYITNQNGVRISMTDYNLLTNIYSDAYIQTMTSEGYENFKAKNININNLVKSEKYYKTVIDHLNNVVTNTEVTENEFNNYNPNIQTLSVSNFVETQYKKLSLTLSDNENGYGDICWLTLENDTKYKSF